MTNEPLDDGATQQNPQPRRTPMGRSFGSISYPADEQELPVDDLRKRPSVKVPHVTGEHWMDRPARNTDSRKSTS
ncbi:MAG: hypothetical protein ABJE10_15120 [bacterium]